MLWVLILVSRRKSALCKRRLPIFRHRQHGFGNQMLNESGATMRNQFDTVVLAPPILSKCLRGFCSWFFCGKKQSTCTTIACHSDNYDFAISLICMYLHVFTTSQVNSLVFCRYTYNRCCIPVCGENTKKRWCGSYSSMYPDVASYLASSSTIRPLFVLVFRVFISFQLFLLFISSAVSSYCI